MSKKTLKVVLVLIIVASIAVFLYNTDLQATKQELHTIGGKFFYLLGITFLAYIFGTLSWYACLGEGRKKIGILQLFAVRQVGETVGQFNPTSVVGGDLYKAELLKPYGIGKELALQSVATSRITIVLSQILLLLFACGWLLGTDAATNLPPSMKWGAYGIVGVLMGIKLSFLYWLMFSKKNPAPAAEHPSSLFGRLRYQLQKLLADIRTAYRQSPKQFWLSYLLAAIHWIIGSLEFYLILIFLGFAVTPLHGLLLDMGVIIFKSAGAFVPGQLGVEEFGNKMMLQLIGIAAGSVWISASILRRSRQLSWLIIGFILYLFLRKNTQAKSAFSNGNIIC